MKDNLKIFIKEIIMRYDSAPVFAIGQVGGQGYLCLASKDDYEQGWEYIAIPVAKDTHKAYLADKVKLEEIFNQRTSEAYFCRFQWNKKEGEYYQPTSLWDKFEQLEETEEDDGKD